MNKDYINMTTDRLLKTVGSYAYCANGDYIGEVVELMRDKDNRDIEYLILESEKCFGSEDRFFAIPACSSLIHIQDNEDIALQVNIDDLQLAKGTNAEECPKPNFEMQQCSIYELYHYNGEQNVNRT